MIDAIQAILERAGNTLYTLMVGTVPPLLAAVVILFIFWSLAYALKWLSWKLIKGTTLDQFFTDAGFTSMLGPAATVPAGRLLASSVFWIVFGIGCLAALQAFETETTDRIVGFVLSAIPKMVIALAILVIGFWLARFLGTSTLIWASNEGFPTPRRWAALVRVTVCFAAVVVAADVLDFAPRVFLAAFIIAGAGLALTVSLALGLGSRQSVQAQLLADRREETERRGVWHHL